MPHYTHAEKNGRGQRPRLLTITDQLKQAPLLDFLKTESEKRM